MENTENKEMETVKQKPKRKHLLAEIEQLKERNKKLEDDLRYKGYTIDNYQDKVNALKAEIVSLKAYIAGVKGDAFPESEDK